MIFKEFRPIAPLQKYINCFWFYEESKAESEEINERIIPDGCIEMVFHLGDRVIRSTKEKSGWNPRCNLIGQMTRPYFIQSTGHTRMIGVRFFPHTASFFIESPLKELTNQVLPIQTVFGQKIKLITEQIQSLRQPKAIISCLESFFLKQLLESRQTANFFKIDAAVKRIFQTNGYVRIDSLANSLDISNRYFEILFKKVVGISPKIFCRITQFQATFKILNQHPTVNLTNIAYLNNYADQAHFIRTCKEFTGVSPKHFFSETHPILANFTNEESISYLFNFGKPT